MSSALTVGVSGVYDHPDHEDESFEHLGPRLHEMDASCSQLHWWEGSRPEKMYEAHFVILERGRECV